MSIFLTDLNIEEVNKLVTSLAEPAYRARQLLAWVYQRLAVSIDEMTDLPQAFRQKLAQQVNLHTLTPIHEVRAKDGTVKILFSLKDGKTVETALMKFPSTGVNIVIPFVYQLRLVVQSVVRFVQPASKGLKGI